MSTRGASTTFIPRLEWRDAEARLFRMEETAREGIAKGWGMVRIVVPVEEPTPPPILLPARIGSILYGPDGRQMKEV